MHKKVRNKTLLLKQTEQCLPELTHCLSLSSRPFLSRTAVMSCPGLLWGGEGAVLTRQHQHTWRLSHRGSDAFPRPSHTKPNSGQAASPDS
ncbi:hypothetical protein E2C01_046437 [Portunus trituberculatus]|uniref:Uncharacterized protein n=1 Tax=Portunus trituberculatus TaxID=210409 RepID=A0A5B7G4S8_PORTR|nr:hypothetical protein [Portunus trituberculatus]